MDRKEELLQAEGERWGEFYGLVERLAAQRMQEPTLNLDGWSVKDLLWHMTAWNMEAARELEKIRLGTYVDRDYDTDGLNRRFLDEGRSKDLDSVRAEWVSSRDRVIEELVAQPEITSPVEEWFSESAYKHADDHVAELRAFVDASE